MARLIDADALLKKLKGTPRYFDVKHDIEEMPTISESEIRAKAIDEFAERVKKRYFFDCNKRDIDEIAEQLKGDAE